MKITHIAAVCLTACLLAPAQAADAPPEPLKPVASLDLQRYQGRWYEIARYPNRFQKHCAADTRADYGFNADGSVRVANRCRTAGGEVTEAIGQARRTGPAQLEVRFAPAWLSWLPWVWGDYWVIDIDPDYQLVAVSEPRREYLWVLARSPKVDAAAYDALLARLQRQGFDLSRLERTSQQ